MHTETGFAPFGPSKDGRRDIISDSFAEFGWEVLRIDAASDAELPPLDVGFALVHPGLGVALIDLAPARAQEPVERLRRRLDAVNFSGAFPGYLPIVYRSLSIGDLWRLPLVLDPPFASKPPLGIKEAGWIALLQQALLVKSAPAAASPPEIALMEAEVQPRAEPEPEPEAERERVPEIEPEPEALAWSEPQQAPDIAPEQKAASWSEPERAPEIEPEPAALSWSEPERAPDIESEPEPTSWSKPLQPSPSPSAAPIQESSPPVGPARRGLHPVKVLAILALTAGVATVNEHGLSSVWRKAHSLLWSRGGAEDMPTTSEPAATRIALPPSETILAWSAANPIELASASMLDAVTEHRNGRIAPTENAATPTGSLPVPLSPVDRAEPVSVAASGSNVRLIGAEAGTASTGPERAIPAEAPPAEGAADRAVAAEPDRTPIVVQPEVSTGAPVIAPAIRPEAEPVVPASPGSNPILPDVQPTHRPTAERPATNAGPGQVAPEGTASSTTPGAPAQDGPPPPEPIGTVSPAPAATSQPAHAAPDAKVVPRIDPPPQPGPTRADPPVPADAQIPRPQPSATQSAPPPAASSGPSPSRAPEARPPAPDPRVVNMLIARGDEMMARGDISGARLFYSRAAAAGSAAAATAMGRSFDPAVLAELGVRGIRPDREQASQWYRRAAELGQPR